MLSVIVREKYILLILLAAPGFIANHIATILGVTSAKKGEFETLGGYLSYSFFAVLLTIFISALLGLINLTDSWQSIAVNMTSINFSVKLLIIALIAGVLTGLFWALFLNNFVVQMLNKINVATGQNKRNLNGSLFNRLFADGKEHFIIVTKDGKNLAVGFIYSASDPFDSKTELSVTEYPEYRAELKKITETAEPSPLRNVLQTYIDIDNGIVITETEFPQNWLNTDYSD